jgi:hypothetical protein
MLQGLEQTKRQAHQAEKTLADAITDKSKLEFIPHNYDVARDITAIREGRTQVEVGSRPYAQLKQEAQKQKEPLAYRVMTHDEYLQDAGLQKLPHAAFYRGSSTGDPQVNVIAYAAPLQQLYPDVTQAQTAERSTTPTNPTLAQDESRDVTNPAQGRRLC